jgi:hypothetical protein
VEVPAVAAADLMLPPPAEGSRETAERVSGELLFSAVHCCSASLRKIKELIIKAFADVQSWLPITASQIGAN